MFDRAAVLEKVDKLIWEYSDDPRTEEGWNAFYDIQVCEHGVQGHDKDCIAVAGNFVLFKGPLYDTNWLTYDPEDADGYTMNDTTMLDLAGALLTIEGVKIFQRKDVIIGHRNGEPYFRLKKKSTTRRR